MVVGDFAIELDTVVIGSGPGGYVAGIRGLGRASGMERGSQRVEMAVVDV